MGYLRRSDLTEAYNRIKRDATGKTCSVLVLVAPTVDAICALKIFTVAHFFALPDSLVVGIAQMGFHSFQGCSRIGL